MDEGTLDRLDALARALLVLSVLVLAMGLLGAFAISVTREVPLFEDFQRQGRVLATLGTFVASVVGSGVLAGLGGILRLLVAERRERAGTRSD